MKCMAKERLPKFVALAGDFEEAAAKSPVEVKEKLEGLGKTLRGWARMIESKMK